jgi:hypothetical protein
MVTEQAAAAESKCGSLIHRARSLRITTETRL